MANLNKMGVIKTWWCQDKECENTVKTRSKNESVEVQGEALLSGSAKTLCMPYDQKELDGSEKCFHCGNKAVKQVLWGRSY